MGLECLLLLIRHFVAPSPIHGLGVHTAVFIPKGAKVWVFHPAIDLVIPRAGIGALPDHVIERIETHGEYLPVQDAFRLGADGDHYMNHCDDPNLENRGDEMFARRDVQVGEELHYDYRETVVLAFDPDTKMRHNLPNLNLSP